MGVESHPVEMRILVVDDHAISRQYMAAALRQITASVKQAGSAAEALTIALSWLPRIVLVDVQLGGESGFALARKIRNAWPATARRPRIIMLSAAAPAADGSSPADGFLVKPVSVSRLLGALAEESRETEAPDAAPPPFPGLHRIFAEELSVRIGELDRCMAERNVDAARAILHQLIASSRLCREPRLEQNLRQLDLACQRHASAGTLARRFHALRASAQEFLEGTAGSRGHTSQLSPPP